MLETTRARLLPRHRLHLQASHGAFLRGAARDLLVAAARRGPHLEVQLAEGFIVTGFGARRLPAALQQQLDKGDDSWVSRGLRRMLGLREKPRGRLSADPTALYKAEMGEEVRIETEEDVLHLRSLPSFDGALRPRSGAAPPVPDRALPARAAAARFSQPSPRALGSPKLQAALDAALFEPGLWQSDPMKAAPQRFPRPPAPTSPRRGHPLQRADPLAYRRLRVHPRPHGPRPRAGRRR